MAELRRINPLGDFVAGRSTKLGLEGQETQNALKDLNLEQAKQAQGVGQEGQRLKFLNQASKALLRVGPERRAEAFAKLSPMAQELGIDPGQFTPDQLTDENLQQVAATTDEFIRNPQALTAAMQEFEGLAQAGNFTEDERSKAARIKARIEAPPTGAAPQIVDVGGVPHIFDKQQQKLIPAEIGGKPVTTEDIAASETEIASRVESGKGQAKLSTKIIDQSFDNIGKARGNLVNLERAIDALHRGGKSGPFQQFLPRLSAASRELKQIQSELGLDVVGAVTFGALSKGELDLALTTALDLGQDEAALIGILEQKKAAQEKLITNLQEAALFLSEPGNTVADFIRSKQPEQKEGGQLMIDANGNRAMVFPDGTFEEVQ